MWALQLGSHVRSSHRDSACAWALLLGRRDAPGARTHELAERATAFPPPSLWYASTWYRVDDPAPEASRVDSPFL